MNTFLSEDTISKLESLGFELGSYERNKPKRIRMDYVDEDGECIASITIDGGDRTFFLTNEIGVDLDDFENMTTEDELRPLMQKLNALLKLIRNEFQEVRGILKEKHYKELLS